jgi:hypothetical protein
MRRLVVLLVLTTLAAGCGTQRGVHSATPSSPESPRQLRAGDPDAVAILAPGAVGDPAGFQWDDRIFHFLGGDGTVVDEQPWTACLGRGCWDGAPGLGGPIPSVGSPDRLYFAFDYPGWTFDSVSFHPVDGTCGDRVATVRATPVTDRVFRIDPAGLRGEWRVDVFGRAPAGGDAVTSVRWTMPGGGSVPGPGCH